MDKKKLQPLQMHSYQHQHHPSCTAPTSPTYVPYHSHAPPPLLEQHLTFQYLKENDSLWLNIGLSLFVHIADWSGVFGAAKVLQTERTERQKTLYVQISHVLYVHISHVLYVHISHVLYVHISHVLYVHISHVLYVHISHVLYVHISHVLYVHISHVLYVHIYPVTMATVG